MSDQGFRKCKLCGVPSVTIGHYCSQCREEGLQNEMREQLASMPSEPNRPDRLAIIEGLLREILAQITKILEK